MFNGIIETLGEISNIEESTTSHKNQVGKTFTVHHQLDESNLKIGDSIAINGVCTTVLTFSAHSFTCFASKETLAITNLAYLKVGSRANLERSLSYRGRIDGHLIYGHIDQTAKLINLTKNNKNDSNLFEFEITAGREYLIPKGSIAINGISLTVYQLTDTSVKVMIIPHTYTATNIHQLQLGDLVNIEFDSMGKYLKQYFDRYLTSINKPKANP